MNTASNMLEQLNPGDPGDLDHLRRVSDDETIDVPTEVAARLEKLGLLMRGWGQTHVVTKEGRFLLGANERR